jgi:hypothetical protein
MKELPQQVPDDMFVDSGHPPLIPHMAHLSMSSSAVHEHNQNIECDLYLMCDPSKPLAFAGVPKVDATAFFSLGKLAM